MLEMTRDSTKEFSDRLQMFFRGEVLDRAKPGASADDATRKAWRLLRVAEIGGES